MNLCEWQNLLNEKVYGIKFQEEYVLVNIKFNIMLLNNKIKNK